MQTKPGQALLLWNLLITGEEPAMSKAKPELKPAERKALVEAGLIRLERRGRSQHLVLEDKAWDWAVEHFEVELAKTSSASPILQKLLLLLGQHLQSHQVSLSSVLRPTSTAMISTENAMISETSSSASNLEDRIRQAYSQVVTHPSEVGVRLVQLRQQLSDFSAKEIDRTLRQMQLAGELVLMALEDPTEITPADEQAALDIDGQKCHIVYQKSGLTRSDQKT